MKRKQYVPSTYKYQLTGNINDIDVHICACLKEFWDKDSSNMDEIGTVYCSSSCCEKYGAFPSSEDAVEIIRPVKKQETKLTEFRARKAQLEDEAALRDMLIEVEEMGKHLMRK
jgi:hypothetical protein